MSTTHMQCSLEKLTVEGNEFGTKVKVLSNADAKYLIYAPTERPEDSDNPRHGEERDLSNRVCQYSRNDTF